MEFIATHNIAQTTQVVATLFGFVVSFDDHSKYTLYEKLNEFMSDE